MRPLQALKQGGVILYPTDTIYGIGSNALSPTSIKKVYSIKGRSFKKPLSIAVSSFAMMQKFTKIDTSSKKLIKELGRKGLFPGPTTLLLKKRSLPSILTNGSPIVGVRIPVNKKCLSIIRKLGKPITTTSANISGGKSARKLSEVDEKIRNIVDAEIDGVCIYKKESTIIDVENRKIVRKGARWKDVQKVLNGA